MSSDSLGRDIFGPTVLPGTQVGCVLTLVAVGQCGAEKAQHSCHAAKTDTLRVVWGCSPRPSPAPAGLSLSSGALGASSFWRITTGPKVFLKPPSVCWLRPCSWFLTKKGLMLYFGVCAPPDKYRHVFMIMMIIIWSGNCFTKSKFHFTKYYIL